MKPLGFHIRSRLANYDILAKDMQQLRIVARCVLAQGQPFGLLAFGLADTHLHAEVTCQRPEAGRFARRVALSLRRRLGLEVPFDATWFEPLLRQGHRYNTFHYCMSQEAKHGTAFDLCHEASNLPDLLGLRELGAYTRASVRPLLRRVDRDRLLEHLGVKTLEPAFHPEHLVESCCSATCALHLHQRSREGLLARRALVHAASGLLSSPRLAEILACSEGTVRRLRRQPLPAWLLPAVQLQMDLRHQLSMPVPG